MPSLYAQYIEERENKHIVEDDKGFATYSIINDVCYIEDIFVTKGYRNKGLASKYADKIAEIAKSKDCKRLMGSVNTMAKGCNTSMQVLMAYGFQLQSANQNMVFFIKEIL